MRDVSSNSLGSSMTHEGSSDVSFERLCAVLENQLRQICVDGHGDTSSEWMTVEDVAEKLKTSRSVVYRWIANGDLEAVNLGSGNGQMGHRGCYRIQRASLNEFIESGEKDIQILKTVKIMGGTQ